MATTTPGDELLEYICQENNQYGIQTIPGYKGPTFGAAPAESKGRARRSYPAPRAFVIATIQSRRHAAGGKNAVFSED